MRLLFDTSSLNIRFIILKYQKMTVENKNISIPDEIITTPQKGKLILFFNVNVFEFRFFCCFEILILPERQLYYSIGQRPMYFFCNIINALKVQNNELFILHFQCGFFPMLIPMALPWAKIYLPFRQILN